MVARSHMVAGSNFHERFNLQMHIINLLYRSQAVELKIGLIQLMLTAQAISISITIKSFSR